jgi:ankyrin repeat protein
VGVKAFIKLLIEYRADRNIENIEGKTPLFVALENGHIQLAKYLLEYYHADPFIKTNKNISALDLIRKLKLNDLERFIQTHF